LQQHLVNYCKLLHSATLVRRPEQLEKYLVTPQIYIHVKTQLFSTEQLIDIGNRLLSA